MLLARMFLARRFRVWRQRLRSVFAREHADDSLSRELAFHLQQLTEQYIAEGLSRRLAREAALRDFGNVSLLEDECRDQRRVAWLHDLKQDLGYGIRQLRSSPGFAVLAAASLAIGIGANTALLSTMEAALRGPLPLPDAGRLVLLRGSNSLHPEQPANATVPEYLAWRERARSFSSIGVSIANRVDLTGNGFLPERLEGQSVSPSLFRTLGVVPLLGRTFTEEEGNDRNPARVIVLSYGLWQRLFGGGRDVLNRTILLNGQPVTVVGVMPQGFWYPVEAGEYWVPIGFLPAQREQSARFFAVTARLKHGVSRAQAQTELDLIAAGLAREFPDRQGRWRARLAPLREQWFGWLRQPLAVLEGASALILLLACTNVATLLLARATVRRPEFAMRTALGASRFRLLRQLLAESLLLASIGGLCGLAVAWGGVRVLMFVQPPPGTAAIGHLDIGGNALIFTAALSLVCALAFSAAPALLEWKGGARVRAALVAAQVSVALILSIGTGLLIKSLIREANEERGFDVDGLLTFDLRVPRNDIDLLRERLAAIPEVASVSAISAPPVNALAVPQVTVVVEGRPEPLTTAARNALTAVHLTMSPGYFRTVRASMARGRDLDHADSASAPWTAVINETMARRFWPGGNPIGQRVTFNGRPGERPRTIVGVVRNMSQVLGAMEPRPVVYTSYAQQPESAPFQQTTFVVRGPRDPLRLAAAIRHAAAEIDPNRPVANLMSLVWWGATGILNRGFYTVVLFSFAAIGTLLACMGVYGVTAYTVAQRTREIGIRLALGAQVSEIRQLLGARTALLIGMGVITGIGGALALTRFLSFQLHNVSPYDPWIFSAAIVVLGLVALAACFAPTRRAAAINPAEVLKQE